MQYFIATIKYSEPVPGTDKIKKTNKKLLVRADSVTEVEGKVVGWFPANWQDPFVRSVTPTPIQDILRQGDSEAWWQVKLLSEDTDSGKWTAHILVANGGTPEIVLPRVRNSYRMDEVDEIKKLKVELDADLLA